MGIEPTYPAWKAGVLPLNYTRMLTNYEIACPEPESNQRHKDFQSFALPTELSGRLSMLVAGVEPARCRHHRILSPARLPIPPHQQVSVDGGGFEPPKQVAADLQSVPFGHSGIHPNLLEKVLTESYYIIFLCFFKYFFIRMKILVLFYFVCFNTIAENFGRVSVTFPLMTGYSCSFVEKPSSVVRINDFITHSRGTPLSQT